MNTERFDNESWRVEAQKLFANIRIKKMLKLVAIAFGGLGVLIVMCSGYNESMTFANVAKAIIFFVVFIGVAFQFFKIAFNELGDIWYFEVGKYIMTSLNVQGDFSKTNYESVGQYFTNVDYKNVLTLRQITSAEIMYFIELPKNLFNAQFGYSEKQMLLDYFADETLSQELKQKTVLEKWSIDKILSRYRVLCRFKQNFSQYDITIVENIFFAESDKVFEKALTKYERTLSDAEQAMLDYSVDILLQFSNKPSNINIVENAFVSCLKIISSEKLEEYMVANKLNALDFSREERILMPKIYTFSNKHNRTNVELAKKTKMLIREDLTWNISNQKRLDSLLEAIGWNITGE